MNVKSHRLHQGRVSRTACAAALTLVAIVGMDLLAGCAGTKYRVANASDTNGIRYYAPATYILVKPDYVNAKANVQLLMLPYTSQLYAVDTYSWMATNDTNIDFKNGMLSKSVTATNSVKIASDLVEAGSAIGQKLLEIAASKAALAASGARLGARDVNTEAASEPVFLFYFDGESLHQIYPRPIQPASRN